LFKKKEQPFVPPKPPENIDYVIKRIEKNIEKASKNKEVVEQHIKVNFDYKPRELNNDMICPLINKRCMADKCLAYIVDDGRAFCNQFRLEFINVQVDDE